MTMTLTDHTRAVRAHAARTAPALALVVLAATAVGAPAAPATAAAVDTPDAPTSSAAVDTPDAPPTAGPTPAGPTPAGPSARPAPAAPTPAGPTPAPPPAAGPTPAAPPAAPPPAAPTPAGPTPTPPPSAGPTPTGPTPAAPTPAGPTPAGPTGAAPTPAGPPPAAPPAAGPTPAAPTPAGPPPAAPTPAGPTPAGPPAGPTPAGPTAAGPPATPPTAPPATAPAPGSGSAPVRTATPLAWAPPELTSPITVHVSDSKRDLRLDPAKDYIVKMPDHPVSGIGGVRINGGRNVVLIGGQIDVPARALQGTGSQDRRGLYLRGQTGTIHVEGLRISGEGLGEGINLDQRLGAQVQLQNVRVDTVTGSRSTNHADVLQTWAGPRQLLVDGLTGHTTYQGFFMLPTQQWSTAVEPEVFDLRRVDLHGTGKSGYLLWRDRNAWPLKVDDVWVAPRDPSRRDDFLWPKGTLPGSHAWPFVKVGSPAAGEFVPVGTAGVGYVSPGYTRAPLSPGGSLTTVTPADGGVRVTSRTADGDTTAPTSVHIPSVDTTTGVTADAPRPDVEEASPAPAGNTGIDTVIPLPGGAHEACVITSNVASGSSTAAGCPTGTVADPGGPQFTSGPSVTPRAGTVSRDGVVPVRAEWSLTDDAGVRAVQLTSPTAAALKADQTGADVDVAAGTSTWALTATDEAGNAASVSGDRTVALVPEQSATLEGYWWPAGGERNLGGTGLRTNRPGASMSYTFHGSSVAWVGMKEAAGGQAGIYLDGVRVATVDLSAPITRHRQVLFAQDVTTGTHTIEVVAERSPTGRTWVTSDGFVTVS